MKAFDRALLTQRELDMLRPDPLLGIFSEVTPMEPFLTICKLRAALLEISCLPSSRVDQAGSIATRALESFLTEPQSEKEEQG